eukprot:CAMPEP_0181135722 /NCGR_PEP_ID=MMETSP1071-20121207/32806_1 /TAXON_ID=35127 /ORGANISM="Thalassiosira sp., Strain NH16" /LENGTH=103 /DNA_ID=CAMNT_0023222393 /DNA_START=139 /DNA_END=451 /DNA_ORIENTATION=-
MVASTRDKQFTLNEDDIHESLLKLQNFDFDPVKDRDDSRYAGGGETAALVASKFKAAVNSIKDYKKGEAETIRRVLDEIDMVSVKRMSEGFNEFNFSMGVSIA